MMAIVHTIPDPSRRLCAFALTISLLLVAAPGAAFEYSSFCPLRTSVGTMEGHYVMEIAATGARFEARIAPFTLAVPGAVN